MSFARDDRFVWPGGDARRSIVWIFMSGFLLLYSGEFSGGCVYGYA